MEGRISCQQSVQYTALDGSTQRKLAVKRRFSALFRRFSLLRRGAQDGWSGVSRSIKGGLGRRHTLSGGAGRATLDELDTIDRERPRRRSSVPSRARGHSGQVRRYTCFRVVPLDAGVVKLADARDSKSRGVYAP